MKHVSLLLCLIILLAIAVISMVQGCNEDDPEKAPEIIFPKQEPSNDAMDALGGGELILVDGCIRVRGALSNDIGHLVIWPSDFTVIVDGDFLEIQNGDGSFVAHMGDKIRMGGGEVKYLDWMPMLNKEQVISQCEGPYWIVGSKVWLVPE